MGKFMFIDRKAHFGMASGWVGWLAAAVLIAAPGLVLGADISWKYTVGSGTMGGGKFTRLGTAVLATGETAEVKYEGTDGASDEKGRVTVTIDSVMRFKDGSSITMHQVGYRDPGMGGGAAGSGEFLSGTGKYQGISGHYTYKGVLGKTEAVGTYTLTK
jgi:hypothetical protein